MSAVHGRSHPRLGDRRTPLADLRIRQETAVVVLRSRLAGRHTVLGIAGWALGQLMVVLAEVAFHRTEGSRRMACQGMQESARSGGCSRWEFPQTLVEKAPCPCPTIMKVSVISGHKI